MTKILIVEDDPMISEIYQKKFSEAGYGVEAADSGEQALITLKTEKIDVMILDLMMPKMDGFEVIKRVREDLESDVKVFIFSNLSQKEDQDKAIKLGANGFIVKSEHTPTTLVKEISRLMEESQEMKRNEQLEKEREAQISSGAVQEKKKLLLIEDEEIFLAMFGDKFRQDGFEVETANNGAWGLKTALKKNFDIFIIDMVMPAMTGEEIITRLKMEEKTKNIPIIALSASVEDHVKDRVKNMGISDFFVKTQIIPSELSKRARELTE